MVGNLGKTMEHEDFPVVGFEFMNEPATEQQKDLICELADRVGRPLYRDGEWPTPFTKWDAANMISVLESALKVSRIATDRIQLLEADDAS